MYMYPIGIQSGTVNRELYNLEKKSVYLIRSLSIGTNINLTKMQYFEHLKQLHDAELYQDLKKLVTKIIVNIIT